MDLAIDPASHSVSNPFLANLLDFSTGISFELVIP